MANLNEWFTVHPRKRVGRTPLTDWAGRSMPKTLSDVYGSYSSKKAAAYEYCRMLCDKFNGERNFVKECVPFSYERVLERLVQIGFFRCKVEIPSCLLDE